jgi:hypothetical protein
VVQTVVHFRAASAHQAVRESPIGHEKAGSEVRGLFARCGAEPDRAKDGTVIVSGDFSRESHTYDMIEVIFRLLGIETLGGLFYNRIVACGFARPRKMRSCLPILGLCVPRA